MASSDRPIVMSIRWRLGGHSGFSMTSSPQKPTMKDENAVALRHCQTAAGGLIVEDMVVLPAKRISRARTGQRA